MIFFQKTISALVLLLFAASVFCFDKEEMLIKSQRNLKNIRAEKNVKSLGNEVSTVFLGQEIGTSGQVVKEIFASHNMIYLNNKISYDAESFYRTTADGVLFLAYGENKKNPLISSEIAIRLRYKAGTSGEIRTRALKSSFGGSSIDIPSSSMQKTMFYLRELFVKISFDTNVEKSLTYFKVGSFPYELGRGIAFGAAYESKGFLSGDSHSSIDQFAPGALLCVDFIKDSLSGDLYYSILENHSSSFADNSEIIRANEIRKSGSSSVRGAHSREWIVAGALHWQALHGINLKLSIDPYAYVYISPDQKVEYSADSEHHLYAVGSAVELISKKFKCGFDAAFQGGHTNFKSWDRNYTNLINDDGVISVQYSAVYSDLELTKLAVASSENELVVSESDLSFNQNGKQIGNSGLYNAVNRFRQAQRLLYHGYFFVVDASYELIENQLELCFDTGLSSGQLFEVGALKLETSPDRRHRSYNGFVPLQSVYHGKRIKHLVMLNTGVPRFTVKNPQSFLGQKYIHARDLGVSTLVNKFSNIAYTGLGLDYKPAKFIDQKTLIKLAALYYWMVDSPVLLDGSVGSHVLGAALSVEFEAIIKDCLSVGGYFGWMVPGAQYKQFSGTSLKGGRLGSDVAYLLNLRVACGF